MNDPIQNATRVSEEEAHRLLARAVQLDGHRRTSTSIAELRMAAEEAGIAPEAFDEAVREVAMLADAQVGVVAVSQPTKWEAVVATIKVAFAFWVALTVLAALGRLLGFGWALVSVRDIVAVGIGLLFATRLRVRWMQVGFIGLGVALAAKLVAHLVFGIAAVQGGPVHLTVFAAGLLGAATVAGFDWIKNRRRPSTGGVAVTEATEIARLTNEHAENAETNGSHEQTRALLVVQIGIA